MQSYTLRNNLQTTYDMFEGDKLGLNTDMLLQYTDCILGTRQVKQDKEATQLKKTKIPFEKASRAEVY